MKLTKYFMVAALALSAVACGKLAPKDVDLKSQNDSLNYAFGLANGDQIAQYYLQNDSDGTLVEQFIKGMQDGLHEKVDTAYMQIQGIGSQIGNSLAMQDKQGLMGDTTLTSNYKLIMAGLRDGLSGADDIFTKDEASKYLNDFIQQKQAEMAKKQEVEMAKQYGKEKAENEAWLANNAKNNPNIKTTASGLQYEVITEGTGDKPKPTDVVKVDYEGRLINDTVFDSSYKRGEPAQFALNQVIPGWTEGLQLMPVGSKYKLYIPWKLGYGAQGGGQVIPPFATLIFTVELKEIVKPETQAAPAPAPAQ